jgi:hypothetical protein
MRRRRLPGLAGALRWRVTARGATPPHDQPNEQPVSKAAHFRQGHRCDDGGTTLRLVADDQDAVRVIATDSGCS